MTSPPISRLLKSIYARIAKLSWDALAGLVLVHWLIAYFAMRQFETGEITDPIGFWYFYVTTATTVGYGDVAPESDWGRLRGAPTRVGG